MMTDPEARASTVLWADDDYDHDRASDGVSRYGVYLRQQRRRFADDEVPSPDPLVFTATTCQVGTGPIMAPGYLRTHPAGLGVRFGVEPGEHLDVTVTLAAELPQPRLGARVPSRALRWVHRAGRWSEPVSRPGTPVLLPRLLARIAIPIADLPVVPRYTGGVPDLDTARGAVRAVAAATSRALAPTLAAYARTEGQGRS